MDRVRTGGYSTLIEAAYELIPQSLHRLIRPHFLCGNDPLFAGLHRFESASYNRSYRNTAHVTYDFHQEGLRRMHRRTTVVLPEEPKRVRMSDLVHELGHVLDEALGFEHAALPVTSYAKDNRYEAFAEAFAAWVMPFGHGYGAAKDALYDTDRATVALFEGLT
jgi:hypothetical protein